MKLRRASSSVSMSLLALALVSAFVPCLRAGERVDYPTDIQPLFDATCSGAFCHVDQEASGVDLTDYPSVMASTGTQYGVPIVVPGRPDESPLWDKVANKQPAFGSRMPLGLDPLSEEEVDRILRWIEEGARPQARTLLRGDFDESGGYDISDPIALLGFLFLGGSPPRCDAVGDIDRDGVLNITDPVFLLGFLFLGGPEPAELSPEEEAACLSSNRPPEPLPIGIVEGREGVLLEFHVLATDPDGDRIIYSAEVLPAGAEVGADTGVVRWTPDFGEAGEHPIEVRVTDTGVPPLAAFASGTIRVLEGNHPPAIAPIGTRYGREGVLLEFVVEASDEDGDELAWELLAAPEGCELDPASGLFRWTPAPGDAGEHLVRVRVTDSGSPPQAREIEGTLVILDDDAPPNEPPVVPTREIYRTYAGRPVSLSIGATDPDGDGVSYTALELPPGAQLDAVSGTFTWTPSGEEIGPAYVSFAVTDDGAPPETAEGLLIFQVLPPDPCVTPDCAPETGCTATLVPLENPCCDGSPPAPVPEPVAGCPEGRVLHAGRNARGFGRLQNCDLLPMNVFAQGGAILYIHVEARCVNTAENVTLRGRLRTASFVLFDRQHSVILSERGDGFAERRVVPFSVNSGVPVSQLEGAPAILSLELSDAGGVVLERELRLILTLGDPPDLPEAEL